MRIFRLALSLLLLGGSFACSSEEEAPCASDRQRCAGQCVDLASDPAHCGACGEACAAGASCRDGQCIASCPEGLSPCDGECVDPLKDPAHCGGCGKACEEAQVCAQGACTPCGVGETFCEGRCVDLEQDAAHCGTCGAACGEGEACEAGSCTCAPGFTRCGDRCVDLQRDASHCGSCEAACAETQRCFGGVCGCAEGESACGDRCVDLDRDPAHCGECGVACGEEQRCIEGSCVCPEGLEACGGACVDLKADASHCGACGAACPAAGENGSYTCENRVCTLHCAAGWADCGGTGVCDTSLDFNSAHCGQCGNACEGGKLCVGGECICPAGTLECDGACIDPLVDSAHCGGCGSACDAGQGCSNGLCCPAGETGCGLACVDVREDPEHCGGCGLSCLGRPQASGGSCSEGTCLLACEGGHLDCNERPEDGCEIDGASDPNNCGECGRSCALQACAAGECVQVTALGGAYSICAVRSDGLLYCWGDPYGDKLGTGTAGGNSPAPVLDPERNDEAMEGVVQTAGGFSHNCALLANGEVRCWGAILFRGSPVGSGPVWVEDPSDPTGRLQDVVQIAGNFQHTCARKSDGRIFCWGGNAKGQLGAGHTVPMNYAVAVVAPEGEEGLLAGTLDVAVGESHSCAIRADRTVLCWGAGAKGQLGRALEEPKESSIPLPVLDPTDPDGLLSGAVQLALGQNHSCALLVDGRVKCWGQNSYAELGNGQSGDSAVPTLVSGLSGVTALAARNHHVCALLEDRTAKCWGYAGSGAIGNGTKQGNVNLPTHVRDPDDPAQPMRGIEVLGVTAFNTCAARKDELLCWGTPPVGDGTTNQREYPTRVQW